MKTFKGLLSTRDAIEYEISNMEMEVPPNVITYMKNNDDSHDDGYMWVIQDVLVNTSKIEMAYTYCTGVTQIDFTSNNSIKLLLDYDDFLEIILKDK